MPTGAKYLVIYFVKDDDAEDFSGYHLYIYSMTGTLPEAEKHLGELLTSYEMSALEKPISLPKASIVKVVKEVH